MGTNCAPLVADLFVFYYERDFIMPLSDNNQTDNIEAFLTPPPDIEITYLILIILILNKW